jgi:hypothetical protein
MTQHKLESLLEFVRESGRVCPMPRPWNTFWKLLPGRRETQDSWSPGLPLILSAWWESSSVQKRALFVEHITWAADNGAIEVADSFLRSLSEQEWLHEGEGPA